MLRVQNGKIIACPFDVTGLFETVEDMRRAPVIITQLLEIELIRNYISEHRNSFITVMLGYSDSVRDGSSLASDAQISRTSLVFRDLQQRINIKFPLENPFEIIFYRGRGDTLPRGFGGSIDGAILSQSYTTPKEDHTEQNRYLRKYFSEESASNHYHKIYSAHIAAQLRPRNSNEERYLDYFDFFGMISNLKWNSLVKEADGGKGGIFFRVLNTYTILPHLNNSHFASRPISRGRDFNIDTIRAIPFTMNLAQLRDFSSGFYGTGTAFEVGSKYLLDAHNTANKLVAIYHQCLESQSEKDAFKSLKDKHNSLVLLITNLDINMASALKTPIDVQLQKILSLYTSTTLGAEKVALLILDLHNNQTTPLAVLREMFIHYEPFKYCVENKETALQIRNKNIIDQYLLDATEEEKAVFEDTETEAILTRKWILDIMDQEDLIPKSLILKRSIHSEELYLLHLIQSHFLRIYPTIKKSCDSKKIERLETYIQMTILAISEGLGFGG